MKYTKTASIAWIAIVATAIISYIFQRHILSNYYYWDTYWGLFCSEQIWQGKKYFYDFFEVNPPLFFLLSVPIVILGKSLLIAPFFLLQGFFFLIIGIILLLNLALLKRIFTDDSVMVYLILFMIALGEMFYPAESFMQREHLMLILFFPYLLLMVIRCQQKEKINWVLASVIGLLAGIGIAIKLYFLVSVVFMEIYYIFRVRACLKFFNVIFRPEMLALLAFNCFYLISIYYYFPEFYFKVMPLFTQLQQPFFLTLPFLKLLSGMPSLIVASFFGAWLYRKKYTDYIQLFILAGTGFLGSYFIAGQNWYYHYYPALVLSSILLTSVLFIEMRMFQQSRTKSKRIKMIFLMYFILALEFWFVVDYNIFCAFDKAFPEKIEGPLEYCQAHVKNENVLILSIFLHSHQITSFCNQAIFASRFPHLALVLGIRHLEKTKQKKAFKKYKTIFFNALNEDIKKKKPALIILDKRNYFVMLNKHHYLVEPLLPFLLSDSVFKAFLSHYKLVKETPYFKIYAQ